MHYDQSWMGYGIIGGLQAGLISAAAGLLLFFAFHWLGRRNDWTYGAQIGWSFLAATILTASGDAWELFYFNYGQLQSLQLLKAKLALVHDPDSIGMRVLCELLGVAIGIYVGWALCSGDWRDRFGGKARH
jgi:multisubunit Na+/H+ antiporter MnhB subunit